VTLSPPRASSSRYNGTVKLRVALDARKLTDYGIGTYLTALVGGLAVREDLQLTLLVRSGHEERAARVAPTARIITCAARGYSVSEHLQMPAALWRERLDLVHFPHYVVPLVMPRPVVVTVHDIIQLFYPPRQRHHLALLYLRFVLRSTLRRARRIITVSKASRHDLMELFGADPRRLVVVPNGVDTALAERPSRDRMEGLKERHGLRPPVTLVVANDKPHKNLDVVLRSYHLARRRHRVPGQLVFLGGPGGDDRLARRARRLGLGGHGRR